jgi:hypothetical protein
LASNRGESKKWDHLETTLGKPPEAVVPLANKHLRFGGRIVLLNAILNAIPIFLLSFLKLLVKVRKKVIRIQREFLWGGVKGGKKVSWVKWEVICKDKSKGGLGVCSINFVNLSLLSKWRWRLLQLGRYLWKEVLCSKV